MTVFAHAGHWAVQLLYVVPVVLVVGVILRERWREKREEREQEGAHPDRNGRD